MSNDPRVDAARSALTTRDRRQVPMAAEYDHFLSSRFNALLRNAQTDTLSRVARSLPMLAILLGFRRATAGLRTWPNTFLMGAPKAGTTALTSVLWNHPAHVEPIDKELMYLQQLPGFTPEWETHPVSSYLWGPFHGGHVTFSALGYKKFFPLKLSMSRRRKRIGFAFTSDCDPFNLYCEAALQKIKDITTAPRIILSLREPISRAYSDWNMHHSFGDNRSFEQAVRDELSGQTTLFRKRFLYQSIYAPHVRRILNTFNRSQIMIIRAEDFFTDPKRIARELYQFLQLPPHDVDLQSVQRSQNRRLYPKELEPEIGEMLKSFFRPHNQALFELLGIDYGWNVTTGTMRS
jgi:hypothetical protein